VGAVLTQDDEGKEFAVTYMSRWLLDTKSGYTYIEKLCLSLYYACTKCQHYLLSNPCMVVCQYGIVKYMLRNLILSGRLGKWAYAMVEYDLAYKPLRAKKGLVDADIIVDHDVRTDHEVLLAESVTWKLFFDGSVCGHRHGHGHGVGCFIVS
jgi:hypothetical protein